MDNPKTRRPRRTNKDLRNDILNAASEVIKMRVSPNPHSCAL